MEQIVSIGTHYLVPASILLGILILVHELGHFIVAKLAGVRVLKFSLGFGPKIIGKKIGETEYVLSLLPLGGYVKPLGESPDEPVPEEDKPFALNHQSLAKRFAVLAAGSLFNIAFAFVIFSCVYMVGIPMLTARVGQVMEDSPAKMAGIMQGDSITAINGRPIELWEELSDAISKSNGAELTLEVRRADHVFTTGLKPELTVVKDIFGGTQTTYKIGIASPGTEDSFVQKRYDPVTACWKGLQDTWKWSKMTVMGLGMLISSPIERRKDIGGPILIGKLAGDFAQVGILSFVMLMAMISVNLGVLNLLPIPILDGGHIFFLCLEAIKGSPISIKKMEVAQQVGLALLLLVMVLVFYNDITRLIAG